MNAGIVTSFLVGGLLLLSILRMNFTVNTSANEATLQTIAKNKQVAISEIISYDINHMGIGLDDPNDALKNSSNNSKIVFQSDIDGTSTLITWDFRKPDQEVDNGNPNDFYLERTAQNLTTGDTEVTKFVASDFEVDYFTSTHDPITTYDDENFNNASQMRITLLTETPEAVYKNKGGSDESKVYGRSFWQHTLIPMRLAIKND